MPGVRNSTVRAQTVDLVTAETELFEDFVVVLTKIGSTSRRHFCSPMHFERAVHRELQMVARAFQRDDHLIREQLRIGRYFLRAPDDAVCDDRPAGRRGRPSEA